MGVEEEIRKWLEEGSDDAEILLDLPWNVSVANTEPLILEATYPRFPFRIRVIFRNEIITLAVDTGIVLYESPNKLLDFKRLLSLNAELSLVRVALSPEEERVLLMSDLERKGVNKDVFADALNMLISSIVTVYYKLGLKQEFEELLYKHILALTEKKVREGLPRDEVVRFLRRKVALPLKMAEKIVEDLEKKEKEIGKSYA